MSLRRVRALSGPARIIGLGTGMVLVAVALVAGALDADAPALLPLDVPAPGLLLGATFFLAEGFVVHLRLRRETQSFSLSEVPFVVGLFVVSPAILVVARLVGSALGLVFVRRQPLLKVVFNMALFLLDAVVVLLVFDVLRGDALPGDIRSWFAAHAAGVVAIVLGTLAVASAIRITEGRTPPGLLRGITRLGLPTAFLNVSLGLITVTVLDADPRAGSLLAALSVALYFFYRSHIRLQSNHDSLSELYAVTRTVDDALERGGAIEALLDRTAEIMRAEHADLILGGAGTACTRFSWDASTRELTRGPGAAFAPLREQLLGTEDSVLLTGRRHRDALDRLGGHREVVLAALHGDGITSGTLMVADRLGNVASFTSDDQRVFEALANHASIAMRNNRLLERLRVEIVEREHQALHDRLTGLPNRTLFDREVEESLADLAPGDRCVVMLIDLDRFKEVNDTLGHQQGDRLLQLVSRRIANAVGADGIVARLGGDEFGVLLPHSPEPRHAVAVAERIRRTVDQPFDLDDLPVAVGASIGIATAPEDGNDAESMLQRADVAMYLAKDGTGIARYEPAANHYSPERLAMVAELRKAIDRAELLVEYQPCIDLHTGAVVSAEALARWHHPQHGFVPPDVFIPIAERSGLIHGITTLVLRSAIRQCAMWRRQGLDIGIAVNLSARSLLDEGLPGEIEHHLLLADLPPTALTLEITESVIVADPARTIGMLSKLSSMGVTLSIDDYGTGYSSLSYLKNLPVDELKMDRTFVTDMRDDPRNMVIVRSTVALAHELGLRVVAEGIEDAETQRTLAELGCDLAQGYHVCRPVTSSQLLAFATGHTAVTRDRARSTIDLSVDQA